MPAKLIKSKKNKGFTLIEIMVCLAIMGFVGVYITYYMIAPINLYNVMSEKSSATTACNGVMMSIHNKVRMAKVVNIKDDVLEYSLVTKDGDITEKIIDGKTYSKSIYGDERDIVVSFKKKEPTVSTATLPYIYLEVTVKEKTKSGVTYSLTQTIKCPNGEA
ncbi:MAG: type II secretion system protein [Oscillospiraceae bacterium]